MRHAVLTVGMSRASAAAVSATAAVLRARHGHVQVPQLSGRHRRRCAGQQALPGRRLGERDHVPDGRRAYGRAGSLLVRDDEVSDHQRC